ncbi:chromosome segregation protein Csm1/Pcs1-domain-containing protein [Aspergillus ambiguus]|uniref:putative chromosome segregation protein (Pcs1) n=1 Tax=Aspergillus ambiguus TaxID=176160 RepID=UPI003CCDE96E
MPKRKATSKLSGLIGSDDEDLMHVNGAQARDSEPPAKKQRGRPRSKSVEAKPPPAQNKRSSTAPVPEEPATRRSTRRGRPKGSRSSGQSEVQETIEETQAPEEHTLEAAQQDLEDAPVSSDELEGPQNARKAAKSAKPTKSTGARRGRKPSVEKHIQTDGEFEYTPTSVRQIKPAEKPNGKSEPSKREEMFEREKPAVDAVDETMVQEEPDEPPLSVSPTKRTHSFGRMLQSSPSKRHLAAAEERPTGEPELRRRIGDLTKKCDSLENHYRNLKEIGIVEANANAKKLRKQCEAMTTASNNLIASLKSELESQKALGQQSRSLQKHLKERDAEVARLQLQVEEATSQLSSAQSEVKALQTKLAAARNTAASLESAAAKAPGSAIKGGSSRANAAATAEAAHAAQFAQLKEDLYSDLTGLIIRDVKRNRDDNIYDCIQTGVNGTLHFKLAVPNVSAANFESAEFQYIPLLDESRDRELVDILPEYLTVDITFVRQQASKFYTRVIDALTKRRASQAN